MRWTSSDGISAMPPPLYADRFLTFVAHEVLHAELAPEAAAIDERWRAGGWLARCKQLLAQWCGLDKAWSRRPRQGGLARWKRLWERRRRGLVRERIDAEHNDYVARIQELEEHVGALEHELGVLRGVNPRAQVTSAELR